MPNHVHVLFMQNPQFPLEGVLKAWKTFTARAINRITGRSGTLWQRDYFDRIVRNEEHLTRCIRYIRNNPTKARLATGTFRLYESELSRRYE